ncbi:MAG: hypothetical protein ACRBFS_17120 [Aureispira sp.]
MNREHRNKLIYARYKKGASQTEIGRLYGLSQSAISKIIIACRQNSFSTSKKDKQEKEPLSTVVKKDTAHSYSCLTDIWSVQMLVKEEFGIHYPENYIRKRMKEIGCRSQNE